MELDDLSMAHWDSVYIHPGVNSSYILNHLDIQRPETAVERKIQCHVHVCVFRLSESYRVHGTHAKMWMLGCVDMRSCMGCTVCRIRWW